jgi:hypothetical protein
MIEIKQEDTVCEVIAKKIYSGNVAQLTDEEKFTAIDPPTAEGVVQTLRQLHLEHREPLIMKIKIGGYVFEQETPTGAAISEYMNSLSKNPYIPDSTKDYIIFGRDSNSSYRDNLLALHILDVLTEMESVPGFNQLMY